jgi:prepilin peptidase CpaA
LDTPLSFALVALVGLAAVTDWRSRRIPNLLTVSGTAVALVLHAIGGMAALGSAVGGMALGLVVGLALLATGGVGAGDAKLLIMIGAFLGPSGFLVALVASAVLGGVMALVWSFRFGMMADTLRASASLAVYTMTLGRLGTRQTLASPAAVAVPPGIATSEGAPLAHFL